MMGVPVGPYGRRYGHLLIGLSHPKKMFEWADIAPKNGIVTPSEHRAALQKNIPKTCAERPFLPPPTVLATAATASATPQAHGGVGAHDCAQAVSCSHAWPLCRRADSRGRRSRSGSKGRGIFCRPPRRFCSQSSIGTRCCDNAPAPAYRSGQGVVTMPPPLHTTTHQPPFCPSDRTPGVWRRPCSPLTLCVCALQSGELSRHEIAAFIATAADAGRRGVTQRPLPRACSPPAVHPTCPPPAACRSMA